MYFMKKHSVMFPSSGHLNLKINPLYKKTMNINSAKCIGYFFSQSFS